MSYFTAVFKDLPQDELVAIAQDERCRFMSHSHVGHERDELRQRVAELATDWQVMRATLATCEKEWDELRQKVATLEQRRRDESDPTSDCPDVLMAKTIVKSLAKERDEAIENAKLFSNGEVMIPISRLKEVESTWLSPSTYEALIQERQETLTELAASEAQLKETRANDLHSMRYLSEIRGMVGGDDYPDMIARIAELVRSEK